MKHNIPIRRLLAGVALVLGLCPGLCLAVVGDMNCDGAVNASDVSPLVLSLIDPAGYTAVYPACNVMNADVDGNAMTDGRDITALVNLLLAPPPQQIVLRDSIGLDNSMVYGNAPIAASHRDGSDWNIVPQYYTAPQALTLSELTVVVGNLNGHPFDFANHNYKLMAWQSQSDFNGSTSTGTLIDVNLDVSTEGPTNFGVDDIGAPIYKLVFDLSAYNITLASGQSFIFGFQDVIQGPGSGIMALIESTQNGTSDHVCSASNPPPTCYDLINHPWRQHFGRVGVSLKAIGN